LQLLIIESASQSLCNRFAIASQSLRHRFVFALSSLCNRSMVVFVPSCRLSLTCLTRHHLTTFHHVATSPPQHLTTSLPHHPTSPHLTSHPTKLKGPGTEVKKKPFFFARLVGAPRSQSSSSTTNVINNILNTNNTNANANTMANSTTNAFSSASASRFDESARQFGLALTQTTLPDGSRSDPESIDFYNMMLAAGS
jgi:hypothetical protein